MSAITTITSGDMSYHNFSNNCDDALMLNMDFKNDSLDDAMSANMDGKRMRKAVFRRTIDYNSSVALYIEQRTWKRKYSCRNAIQPDIMYQHLLTPPMDYRDNPMNCVCAKHVRTSTNKNKCPIYAVCWTPDGRRLITGASSGEFTLWNGLTFNFETILQAHDTHIRAMKWSNNEEWLVSADDAGYVKYWQANMNDVNVFQAHKDSVRGVSFCPSDEKFVTCSNDNTVRIWDFQTYKEERVLRGHGGEVRCVAWHPTRSLLLSGSKDSQQPLKLWDPKAGECISTMYVHKSTCTDIGINKNGNWFLTASKDHYIKLFDLRNLKTEMQVFRGHKKDVIRVAWHPYHETLFASGSGDGALLYWLVGTDMEVGAVEDAHDNIIWSLDWHPMGHILASGSNDFATKFWTRNRPGDVLKDNLQEEKVGGAFKTEQLNTSSSGGVHNPDVELENMIKQSENEKVFDFDIHKLSSTIEAEIEKSEKSDIPGLSEGGLIQLEHDILGGIGGISSGAGSGSGTKGGSMATDDDDLDERESRLRGSVSRTIPKQFAANWANKKSIPVVCANNETGTLFSGVTGGPILPSSSVLGSVAAAAAAALAATIPITPLGVTVTRPTPLGPVNHANSNNNRLGGQSQSLHEMPPFVPPALQQQSPAISGHHGHHHSLQQQHHYNDDMTAGPLHQQSQMLDDINGAPFRMMRPPSGGSSGPSGPPGPHGNRNFRSNPPQMGPPRNQMMGPPPSQSGRDSQFQNNYQNNNNNSNSHQQQQFRGPPFMDFRGQDGFPMQGGGGGGYMDDHSAFGGHQQHQQNNHHHQLSQQQQQQFPPFQSRGGGDYPQNRHMMRPSFRPDFNLANDDMNRGCNQGGDFMRPPLHRPHGNNQNRRGGGVGGGNNRFMPQQQQRQFLDEGNENPFEPSKSTGSSKSFIPLPQKHDDQQNKRNKGRVGNRPVQNW